MSTRRYIYKGDRHTDPRLKGQPCEAVLRKDGKCITGRSAMLVKFGGLPTGDELVVVQRRMLQKDKETPCKES